MKEKQRRLSANLQRGQSVQVTVDGEIVEAYDGETIAAALIASGRRVLRHTTPGGYPRGIFCGIGLCYDCLVTVKGMGNVRACVTLVRDGMEVTTSGR